MNLSPTAFQDWRWTLDLALQTTLLLGAAMLTATLLQKRSAALAHAIVAGAILALPVLMLCGSLMPRWAFPLSPAASASVFSDPGSWTVKSATTSPSTTTVPQTPSPSTAAPQQQQQQPAAPFVWTSWLGTLWLAGALTGLLSLGLSLRRLRSLERRCQSLPWTPAIESACRTLGLQPHRIRLLTCDEPLMPMTWGWRRACIVLPSASQHWPELQRLTVLRHELAHVARGDALTHFLCWISALSLWWHPLVWLALRQAAKHREQACDDAATRRLPSAGRQDYAEQLVRTIADVQRDATARIPWLPALAMAMASRQARVVKARLAALLDDQRNRQPLTSPSRWATALVLTSLALSLAGLCACRETSRPVAIAKPAAASEEARVYFLTDLQWQQLTLSPEKVLGAATAKVMDPFAPGASTQPVKGPHDDNVNLKAAALRIRTRLIERGITFNTQPGTTAEPVTLTDDRTLQVRADAPTQERITKLLTSLAKERSVQVSGRIIALPADSVHMERMAFAASPNEKGRFQAIISAEQGTKLIEEMKTWKDAALMSSPFLTLNEGKRGNIEMVREFLYPTEFDPPQVPSTPSTANGQTLITPTTPTAFEMRPIGIRMEVEVSAGEDDKIKLAIAPEVTAFEGFVNYGTPIQASTPDPQGGKPTVVMLSENKIPMPLFSTTKTQCSAQIEDGGWLIIGGLGEPEGNGGTFGPAVPGRKPSAPAPDEDAPGPKPPLAASNPSEGADAANQAADLVKLAAPLAPKRLVFFALQITRTKQ